MTSSSPTIRISPATPSDFPSLAQILPIANASNPIHHLMFKRHSSTSSNEPPSVRWAMTQFGTSDESDLKSGGSLHVLKAVSAGHETAVGYAMVKVFDNSINDKKQNIEERTVKNHNASSSAGKDESLSESDVAPGREVIDDPTLEPEFCAVYLKKLNDVYERHMKGKPHAYWSSLMVLPSYQRQGVGSALIEYALKNLNIDELPIWIYAQPDGYNLYRKFGWKDVENVDMQLDQWAGTGRGYGLHRTVCMLREPSNGE